MKRQRRVRRTRRREFQFTAADHYNAALAGDSTIPTAAVVEPEPREPQPAQTRFRTMPTPPVKKPNVRRVEPMKLTPSIWTVGNVATGKVVGMIVKTFVPGDMRATFESYIYGDRAGEQLLPVGKSRDFNDAFSAVCKNKIATVEGVEPVWLFGRKPRTEKGKT